MHVADDLQALCLPGDQLATMFVLQLDMRGLDGVFSFKGSVAGSVNNALHIAKEQTGVAAPLPVHNASCMQLYDSLYRW